MSNEVIQDEQKGEVEEKPKNSEQDVSETALQAIELCKSLGLRPIYKRGYVAFKSEKNNSNVLTASRLQCKNLKGFIFFIKIDDREKFPEEIKKFVSEERHKGRLYFTGETLDELEFTLRIYLEACK